MITRREMREHCFKMLFGADFYPADETVEQVEQYFNSPEEYETTPEGTSEILHQIEMSEEDQDFLKARAELMASKFLELDELINEVTQGWKTRRMGKVELTILRQALYEMKYDEEVPQRVAINEAVEIAKKFGGTDSPAFINGVLAKLVTLE